VADALHHPMTWKRIPSNRIVLPTAGPAGKQVLQHLIADDGDHALLRLVVFVQQRLPSAANIESRCNAEERR